MEERLLIVVSTSFQMIVAIQLKLKLFSEKKVDIIVTDYSNDSKVLASRLKDTKVFENVYTANVKGMVLRKIGFKKVWSYLKAYVNPEKALKEFSLQINNTYDKLLFFNLNLFTQLLYKKLVKLNNNLICERFEEGYNIYIKDGNIKPRTEKLQYLIGKTTLSERIKKIYLFNPELVRVDLKCQIEEISVLSRDDERLKDILNNVFNYTSKKFCEEKYIIFEETFFADNENINDIELFEKIADVVGKENILIKLHPRNPYDRFSEKGFKTNSDIGTPWELIQLNNDFNDKVLLTIASGSILASSLYFKDDINSIFLYKCTNNIPQKVNDAFIDYLENLKVCMKDCNFVIPQKFADLKKYLLGAKNEVVKK